MFVLSILNRHININNKYHGKMNSQNSYSFYEGGQSLKKDLSKLKPLGDESLYETFYSLDILASHELNTVKIKSYVLQCFLKFDL